MPYIAADARGVYDVLVADIISVSGTLEFSKLASSIVFEAAGRIYGRENTRYFMQNEFAGVLSCALLEWCRRTGCEYPRSKALQIDLAIPAVANLAERLCSLMPHDPSTRPGHFNYFISTLFIAGVQNQLIDVQASAELFLQILNAWYGTVTAPYEDGAIQQNGDCYPKRLLNAT